MADALKELSEALDRVAKVWPGDRAETAQRFKSAVDDARKERDGREVATDDRSATS